MLICIYIGIFHSHRYYGFDVVFWIFIISFASICTLDGIWLDHGKWHKLKTLLVIFVGGGSIAALVVFLHSAYVKEQLTGHEVITKGVVTKVYVKRGKKSRIPYALFSYQVNGKSWTQTTKNTDYRLQVGDSLKLMCSKLDPEVFLRLEE